jgi:hypothetical protein
MIAAGWRPCGTVPRHKPAGVAGGEVLRRPEFDLTDDES